MTELAGVVLGALLAYWFGFAQQRQDLRRQRRRFATALLSELRTIEYALRKTYEDEEIGLMGGDTPVQILSNLHDHILLFPADTVDALLQFRGLVLRVNELRRACEALPVGDITDNHHWKIRAAAGFALQALPLVKTALEREGGAIPKQPPVERVTFPELPKLPPPAFQWSLSQARLGQPNDPAPNE